jgi:hypothetical protein
VSFSSKDKLVNILDEFTVNCGRSYSKIRSYFSILLIGKNVRMIVEDLEFNTVMVYYCDRNISLSKSWRCSSLASLSNILCNKRFLNILRLPRSCIFFHSFAILIILMSCLFCSATLQSMTCSYIWIHNFFQQRILSPHAYIIYTWARDVQLMIYAEFEYQLLEFILKLFAELAITNLLVVLCVDTNGSS